MGELPPDDDDDDDGGDGATYDHERTEQEALRELEDRDNYPPENSTDDAVD